MWFAPHVRAKMHAMAEDAVYEQVMAVGWFKWVFLGMRHHAGLGDIAGGLPPYVFVAATPTQFHLLEGHEAQGMHVLDHSRVGALIGSWPQGQLHIAYRHEWARPIPFFRFKIATFTFPDRPPAQMQPYMVESAFRQYVDG